MDFFEITPIGGVFHEGRNNDVLDNTLGPARAHSAVSFSLSLRPSHIDCVFPLKKRLSRRVSERARARESRAAAFLSVSMIYIQTLAAAHYGKRVEDMRV